VFPGLNGGCAVTFYQDDKSVEVVIDPERHDTFGLHVEAGKGFQFQTILEKDDALLHEVVEQARKLLTEAWKSYESSPSISSTQSDYAFQTLSSSTRPGWVLAHLMVS
jgi:hypothetical protein